MIFGEKILKYKDEILRDLDTLLKIRSVRNENDAECDKALAFILNRAKDFGLISKRVTSESGHAQLGCGNKLCAVLTHLDVVPAGNGWSVEPFALTEKNGRLFGRGIADDKGAALITLYCLRALKEENVEGKNTIRAVFGTSEECGMEDMDGYFDNMPLPDMAFTPDSNYGICCAEKGILQLKVSSRDNDATVITQLNAGKAVNSVPDAAYALIDSSSYDEQLLSDLAEKGSTDFEFKSTIDGLMIICKGKASHACEPDKGINAASALIELISKAYKDSETGSLCSFINCAISNETNGRSIGLKMRDCTSGSLTVNLGSICIEENTACACFDIRYPVTVNGDSVLEQFKKVAEIFGLSVEVLHHNEPINCDKDSPLISLLSDAYEKVMGKKPELYSTGGGTYARKLGGRGVAFGPSFGCDDVRMHNSDESIDKALFFKHAEICLEAMYSLYIYPQKL